MSLDLPMMKCDPNCGECCGIVLCNEAEYQQVIGFAKNRGIEPIRQGITCPFYQGGLCAVHEARPFVCRLFGHSPRLNCCKGYNTNLPPQREARLSRDYLKRGQPTRLLHEAAYSADELPGILTRSIESLSG